MAKSKPPEVKLQFDVIDERLRAKCAGIVTDKSYGKCVLEQIPQAHPQYLLGHDVQLSERYISRGPALVRTNITGEEIIGGSGLRRRLCTPSKPWKPLGDCRVELDVPSVEDQRERGLPNTPVLRFCSAKKKEGTLVPVATPEEAVRAVTEFCNCSSGQSSAVRTKCARKIHG